MDRTRARMLDFLRAHQVVTLAVTGPRSQPHAAALFYAVDDDLCLYVLTDPSTRHGEAMQREGQVAGTIQRDRQQWKEIQGIQLWGRCSRLTGQERARAWDRYQARFPFLRAGNAALSEMLRNMLLWRVEPDWMRLIDNRLGFGHKEEWKRSRGTWKTRDGLRRRKARASKDAQ